MLVRICILLCAGILLVTANPVPQDIADPDLTSNNEQPQENNPSSELPINDNDATENDSGTEAPLNPDEGAVQSAAENGNEQESESGSVTDETLIDNANEGDGSTPENDAGDNGSESNSAADGVSPNESKDEEYVSEREHNGEDNESGSNSGADETSSNNNKDEENTSEHENNESDNGSDSNDNEGNESETESDGNSDESKSGHDDDSKLDSDTNESSNNSEENDSGLENENSDGSENESDNGSESDESSFDSESDGSDDDGFDTSDEESENEEILSIIKSNGVILRVYKVLKDNEELICQEIKKADKILENKCFTTTSYFPHVQADLVSVFNKYVDGQNYICQEIINFIRGPIQVLCASQGSYFYHESQVLHTDANNFSHLDFNIPFY